MPKIKSSTQERNNIAHAGALLLAARASFTASDYRTMGKIFLRAALRYPIGYGRGVLIAACHLLDRADLIETQK